MKLQTLNEILSFRISIAAASFFFWNHQIWYCNLGSLVTSIVTDSLSIFLSFFFFFFWWWGGTNNAFQWPPKIFPSQKNETERAFCRKTRSCFHYIRHELKLDWKGGNAYIECLDSYAYYFHSESLSMSIFLYYANYFHSVYLTIYFIDLYFWIRLGRLPSISWALFSMSSIIVVYS